MQVWKFAIGVGTGDQHLPMPAGARPLAVQMQDGLPQLWALCDAAAPIVTHRVAALGTGDDVPEGGRYIATLQAGRAVLHYFHFGEVAG